jgi:hypothetical protein
VDKKILHNGSFCSLGGKERRVSFFTFVLSKIRDSNGIDAAFIHAGMLSQRLDECRSGCAFSALFFIYNVSMILFFISLLVTLLYGLVLSSLFLFLLSSRFFFLTCRRVQVQEDVWRRLHHDRCGGGVQVRSADVNARSGPYPGRLCA